MIKCNLNVNYYKIFMFDIFICIVGFNIYSFAQPDPLTLQERALINKCGLVCKVADLVWYDFDITRSNGNTGTEYVNTSGLNIGQATLKAGLYTAVDAIALGIEEGKIELAESKKLTNLMHGWNFERVFRATLDDLMREAPFETYFLSDTINQKDIRKNKDKYLNMGLNAILEINVPRYGIQSIDNNLFTVFIYANLEIKNLTDNTILASKICLYTSKYAKEIYNKDIQWYRDLEKYKNKETSPDSLFCFPYIKTSYDSFIKDNGKLLKKELKIAAVEACRMIYSFLFLADFRKKEWLNDYRIIPTIN